MLSTNTTLGEQFFKVLKQILSIKVGANARVCNISRHTSYNKDKK